jgi:hypothetical protein
MMPAMTATTRECGADQSDVGDGAPGATAPGERVAPVSGSRESAGADVDVRHPLWTWGATEQERVRVP